MKTIEVTATFRAAFELTDEEYQMVCDGELEDLMVYKGWDAELDSRQPEIRWYDSE